MEIPKIIKDKIKEGDKKKEEKLIEKDKEMAKILDAQKKAGEEAQKKKEDQMRRVVNFSREKLLPFLKKYNLSVDKSKFPLEIAAMTIQQSQYNLMEKTKISELGIIEMAEISSRKYPENKLECLVELLNIVADMNMADAIETLQWMVAKMDAVIKEENKKRDFNSLNIDF